MKQTLICLSGDPGAISGGFSTRSPACQNKRKLYDM